MNVLTRDLRVVARGCYVLVLYLTCQRPHLPSASFVPVMVSFQSTPFRFPA